MTRSCDQEIDEMIETVDRNEDWKINYSEFRVSQQKSELGVRQLFNVSTSDNATMRQRVTG